jgi:hypothetical protein
MIVKVGSDYIDLTKIVGMSKRTSNGYPEYPYIAFHVAMGEPIRAGNFGCNESEARNRTFENVYGLWKKLKETSGFKQVQIRYTYTENNNLLYKVNTIKMNADVDDLILEVERLLTEKSINFESVTEAIIIQ